VVWVKPAAADAARVSEGPVYRKTVPANATATIDFSYSVNSDCTARSVPRLWLTQRPAHGEARVGQRVDFPRFPPNSPFAACDTVKVAGMALDYTPARGFTGADFLAFEVVDSNSQHRMIRVALTVQ
jgi:hypothetical protein